MRYVYFSDTDAYKQRLLRLSQRIRDFKESCQVQALSQEQAALESELREFQSNLHKYEKSVTGKPTSSNMENKRRHDYKEIQDLHALIAKTGISDGISIRLRHKHKLRVGETRNRQECRALPSKTLPCKRSLSCCAHLHLRFTVYK